MKKHSRTHIGEKPFPCGQGTKSFSQAGDLKMHRRTHISEKLVISVLKSFLKACHFKMHKITHGGENLFLVISVPSHFLDLTT